VKRTRWHHAREAFRAELRSVRIRVLATVLTFMAAGLFLSGAATHALQLARLNESVNVGLLQPSERLRTTVADGINGVPYSTPQQLFNAFLSTDVPGGHESVVASVQGSSTFMPAGEQATNLCDHMGILWDQREVGRTVFRDMEIEGRTVRVAITSVMLGPGHPEGLLVAGNELGRQRDEVMTSLLTYGIASLSTLALAGGVGFVVTGRLLDPVKKLREATEVTTTEDLTRRVHVPSGEDDVSQLAVNFNHMLDRLEAGFTEQRRFMDDAGHELRTPLTIIGGHLELLQASDAQDVEQTRELLLDELGRMQALVDELLMLARSCRPDFIRHELVDTDGLLESVLDRVKVLANRDWQIDFKPGGEFHGDRHRLTQALEQLVANAVRHTTDNDRISVGASRLDRTVTHSSHGHGDAVPGLELWVADTGTGVPPEDLDRIFDRFARAANAPSGEGSGLGLPIVKAIAEAHGGSLSVESEVGQGSRFVLWLPLEAEEYEMPSGRHQPALTLGGTV
jgi:two-component system, OmpR family, sensor kinase